MDAEALRQAMEQASLAAAGMAFLAGLVFSFNPVALASIPVSLAYVTRGRDKSQALLFGAMFILGMILTHVFLGFIGGLGGKWAAEVTGRAPAAVIRVPSKPPDSRLGCLPSRDSVCDRSVPRVHTGVGRVAWRDRRNRFGFARRGPAPRICSRPRRSTCDRSLRR